MSEHWKHRATRCAVDGCERTRVKGRSTCALIGHYERGVSLYGLRPGEPRLRDPKCNGHGGSHGGHVLHHPDAPPCPVHPPADFIPRG